jgi:hypothetical protein
MRRLLLVILVSLLLSSCASQSDQKGEQVQAATIEPSDTLEPTRTYTPTPTSTNTLQPSATLVPSATPSFTPTTPLCTNKAEFVRHLSISDHTELSPGVHFAKVWRIKNAGTCTWNQDYSFVFDSGDEMSSPSETPLTREVLPGETVDIQVVLVTPMEPDNYAGNWLLSDPSGVTFGSGETGTQPFSAIVVVEPIKINERKETLACG